MGTKIVNFPIVLNFRKVYTKLLLGLDFVKTDKSKLMKNNEIQLLPEGFYHIYNHANGWENLFKRRENYIYFLRRYAEFINPIADTFAYCLMPNHLHFMVRIKKNEELQAAYQQRVLRKASSLQNVEMYSKTVLEENALPGFISREWGSLFSAYSQAFNRQQHRKGSLFIPNFKRKPVETTDYYLKLIHYIHANPIHHGFVKGFADWEFSSYHTYLSTKPTHLARQEGLEWFGGSNLFEQFHRENPVSVKIEFE